MFEALSLPFLELADNAVALLLVAAMATYLGVYLVCRRVVFVAVALGEVGAMGSGLAFLLMGWVAGLGIERHVWKEHGSLAFSVFAILLTVFFLGSRRREGSLSQESLLGVVFCLAAALAILFVWFSDESRESLTNLLTGDVLILSQRELLVLSTTFAGLLTVHGLFRRQFLFCSFDPTMAQTLGVKAKLFEVLLHLSIGVAVAVGMRSAGLLLQFSLMLLPAASALLLQQGFGRVQLVAFAVGTVGCAAGVIVSFSIGNVPLAPATVTILGGLFLLSWGASKRPWSRRVFLILLGIATTCSLGFFTASFYTTLTGRRPAPAPSGQKEKLGIHTLQPREIEALLRSERSEDQHRALTSLESWDDPHSTELLARALESDDDSIRREAIVALGRRRSPLAVEALLRNSKRLSDDLALELADALIALKEPEGIHILTRLISDDKSFPFQRDAAYERLKELTGEDFALDSGEWSRWWEKHHLHLRFTEGEVGVVVR